MKNSVIQLCSLLLCAKNSFNPMKYSVRAHSIWRNFFRFRKPCPTILGIESSCDDTACAVVNGDRKILGECVKSQLEDSIRMGGILPTMVRDWHEENIEYVVNKALENAGLTAHDVDAIAVTMKPGLAMSLAVGMNYGKFLSREFKKPFIPIHHMEAHALTARLLNEKIQYPFLTLLISGGHCILAVAQSVDKFITLGRHRDNAPGEILDKIARRLKLHNLPHLSSKSGGAAIEEVARTGNSKSFPFTVPFRSTRHCDFSFAGYRSQAFRVIERLENKYGTEGDQILPNADDLCASLQYYMIKHVLRRMQRGMDFIRLSNLIPETNRLLVVSGGVACNSYFRRAFEILCQNEGYDLYVPPAKYCNDNGVMIAWNGIERFNQKIGVYNHRKIEKLDLEPQCPLGEDYTERILHAQIRCDWMKLGELHTNTSKVSSKSVVDNVEQSSGVDVNENGKVMKQ